jgi:hypothetical protein
MATSDGKAIGYKGINLANAFLCLPALLTGYTLCFGSPSLLAARDFGATIRVIGVTRYAMRL